MSNSETVWSEIVSDAKQRGHLFDAKDAEDLTNLILNVKNELDELADLMNPNSVLFSSTRWKVWNKKTAFKRHILICQNLNYSLG